MNTAESFSADYAEARAKFVEAAKAAGGALERIDNPNKGPDGGELSTDVAWFGPRSAEKVLVMISGTHGVEGFCGSGAQVDWLKRGEAASLPAGVAALLVHAVNPYGFAWLRRVTEENVDLNRNWIDFASNQRPENAGYDELADILVPQEWSPEIQTASFAALLDYGAAHGSIALQQVVTGGQYKHPKGVFYGGAGATWARQTQEATYEHYLGQAGRIGIIDYHTALGPWGYAETIVSAQPDSESFRRAQAWYGRNVTSHQGGTSVSAALAGDNLAAAPALLPHAEVTAVFLEYGTLEQGPVLNALRADAWLHAYADLASPQGQAIKAQVRDAFYGDADDWKGMVVGQSLASCRNALKALGAP